MAVRAPMVAEGRRAGHWHQCGHGRLRIQEGTWQAPDGARMGIFTHPTVSRHTCRHLFGRLEACFQLHELRELESLLNRTKGNKGTLNQGLCTQSPLVDSAVSAAASRASPHQHAGTRADSANTDSQTTLEGTGVRGQQRLAAG